MYQIIRIDTQLGNAIRRERRKQNITQGELGQRVGMHQETISRIEHGNGAIKLSNLLALLAALGLEMQLHPRSQTQDQQLENLF